MKTLWTVIFLLALASPLPAHAAGEITRLIKAVREDRMPLDEAGIEQPLEPTLKRALLESGGAFEELVQAAKQWEAAQRN